MKYFRSPFFATLMLTLLVFTSCEKTIESSISDDPVAQYVVASSDLQSVKRLQDIFDNYPSLDRWDTFVTWVDNEGINMNTPENGRAYLTNSYADNLAVLTNSGNLNSTQLNLVMSFENSINYGGLSFEAALANFNEEINAVSGSAFQIGILHTFADGMELTNQLYPNLFPQVTSGPSPVPLLSPCAQACWGMAFSVIGGLCSAATIIGAAASIGGIMVSSIGIDENC